MSKWLCKSRKGVILETYEGEDAEEKAEGWLDRISLIRAFAGSYIEKEETKDSKANKVSIQAGKATSKRLS